MSRGRRGPASSPCSPCCPCRQAGRAGSAAVCAYSREALEEVFEGKYKELNKESSRWTVYSGADISPRPGSVSTAHPRGPRPSWGTMLVPMRSGFSVPVHPVCSHWGEMVVALQAGWEGDSGPFCTQLTLAQGRLVACPPPVPVPQCPPASTDSSLPTVLHGSLL